MRILSLNVWGDSTSVGAYAGTTVDSWQTNGYIALLRKAFKDLFQDVGFGLRWIYYNWVFSGNWTVNTTGYGIYSRNYTTSTSGENAHLSFNGTGIILIVLKGSDKGTINVNIDNGTNTTYDTSNSTTEIGTIEINNLNPGDHTVYLTKTNDNKPFVLIGAIEQKGSYGVRVHNMSRGGGSARDIDSQGLATMSLELFNPSLTIINLLINDVTRVTTDAYKTEIEPFIQTAKAQGDVLIITPMIDAGSSPYRVPIYIQKLYELADKYDCALLDLYRKAGGDINYFTNILGLMYDAVHPNTAGHQYMYIEVEDVLIPNKIK
jgi:lysophospholipase L1-like esterase